MSNRPLVAALAVSMVSLIGCGAESPVPPPAIVGFEDVGFNEEHSGLIYNVDNNSPADTRRIQVLGAMKENDYRTEVRNSATWNDAPIHADYQFEKDGSGYTVTATITPGIRSGDRPSAFELALGHQVTHLDVGLALSKLIEAAMTEPQDSVIDGFVVHAELIEPEKLRLRVSVE